MSKLKILELFGGIGACSKSLERLGIDYEIADYVEIDKYAVKSFNAIHNTNFEPQDICKWDKDIEVDLIMHGSPCQDFSLAGKQAGGDKNSGTRSSLMYETIRIVQKLKPKYIIWENVKNLLSKKHIHNFNAYLETMEQLGYMNYYQVLNAKDYGIPQNRERIFTISIRKDINKVFTFPQKQELELKLKDMLEDEVDEKYYLSNKMIKYISADNEKWTENNDKSLINKKIASAINTGEGSRRCDASNYISTNFPENADLKAVRKYEEKEDKTFIEKHYDNFKNKKGYIPEMFNPYNESEIKKVAPTQSTQCGSTTSSATVLKREGLRIRKLTPKECWRLMGFDDEDFEKASQVNSCTQLYKQAGNSICVPVLIAILNNLLNN